MKRKWIVLAGVALALGALVTVAVAEHGEKTWEYPMLGHLDLNDEQKEQLQKLHEEQREAMAAIREQLQKLREKHVEALREQREEYRKAMENILTDEQRASLRPYLMWAPNIPEHILLGEHLESIKGSIGDIRESIEYWGNMRGIERAFAKLDLTDEQKEQLKDLHKAQREEFHKWRQKQRKAMENILTDEQREKLEMLKDEAFYGSKYGAFR